MAKQTFTTGQVLTAAQMTSLQQTAMLGGAASAKTASYTLVAADAGTAISMSNASPTTITVNTALFAEGDTVQITNIGAGVCTITAGTATVNTAASLALAQYESGTLDFTSTSSAIFIKAAGAAAGGGGKVLQVVQATTTTSTTIASTTFTDTTLSGSITPSAASSKILIMVNQVLFYTRNANQLGVYGRIMRNATSIYGESAFFEFDRDGAAGVVERYSAWTPIYLDSPATTSSITYKTQGSLQTTANSASSTWQPNSQSNNIILMEIGA
jgi:hypothetical protein